MRYRVKNTGGKHIKTGRETAYVSFDFGACAYVGYNKYLGYSQEECLKLRSDAIDGYVKENKFYKIKSDNIKF